MSFADYGGRRVLVTGHTGFKGAWLCEWLLARGARVSGYALEAPTEPALYDELGLGERLQADLRADVRSAAHLRRALAELQPEFVFHLAAQSLVRRAFDEPHETVDTNAMGTANLLEALRLEGRPCVAVLVTTDKVYENRDLASGYSEDDPLGGHDLYSASKACAELIASAYRRSFFANGNEIAVATARAGNVIGGGDWAEDRIVPDAARALAKGEPIPVRNKASTRPWQHVLEPLAGYLLLGAEIDRAKADPERRAALCTALNFGPDQDADRSVEDLVGELLRHWPGEWSDLSRPDHRHEASRLALSSEKAGRLLGWRGRWDFATSVECTAEWYRAFYEQRDRASLRALTQSQIERYERALS